MAPGSSFGPGGKGYFRVALVPSLEECEEAIARWEDLVRKTRRVDREQGRGACA
jgi:aspartate/methionine/tyrosine aminotransferase